MGLITFIRGDDQHLSADAERGRRDLLLAAAGLWITPVVLTVHEVVTGSALLFELITTVIWNVAIFVALANGRPWARKLTLFLTALVTLRSGLFAFAGLLDGVSALGLHHGMALINTMVYGSASWLLWKSPAVRAYFESRRGGPFVFPTRPPEIPTPPR